MALFASSYTQDMAVMAYPSWFPCETTMRGRSPSFACGFHKLASKLTCPSKPIHSSIWSHGPGGSDSAPSELARRGTRQGPLVGTDFGGTDRCRRADIGRQQTGLGAQTALRELSDSAPSVLDRRTSRYRFRKNGRIYVGAPTSDDSWIPSEGRCGAGAFRLCGASGKSPQADVSL